MRVRGESGAARLWACCLCVWCASGAADAGDKPATAAVVQALQPAGMRVAVPDYEGVDVVLVKANINAPIEREAAQVSGSVLEPEGGFWTLERDDIALKPGDVVFYSIYVSRGEKGSRLEGHQAIHNLVDRNCRPSPTTVNGKSVCADELIFEDNFDTLNTSIWKHNIQFSDIVDNDFSIYTDSSENSFVKDGKLHLRATLLKEEELLSANRLEKCTWEGEGVQYCERQPVGWDILPPTRSAYLTTKGSFAFKFGRIEIRAKTAAGDWLMSRLILDPRAMAYGPPLRSGRVELLRSRGNPDMVELTGWHLDARLNDPQADLFTCGRALWLYKNCPLSLGKLFSDDMHVFAATWTPRGITITVDGGCVNEIRPPEGGFLKHDVYRDKCRNSPWERGSFMAPFDREFYIHIRLMVAGRNSYPGGVKSRGHPKPWDDFNPKAFLNFWQNRNNWFPTWKSDMEVDYVKVWAV